MERKLTIKTIDNYDISAIHTVSKGKGIILWLHGITVNKDEYLNFFGDGVKYLYDKGFDSLRFDFRGHGESSGTSLDFSIVGQMLDVNSVMEYLIGYYKKKSYKVNLVGCSFGAPPAIFTAINYKKYVSKVILISPVISYKDTFLEPRTEWAKSIFNKKTLSDLKKKKKLFIDDNFPISYCLVEEMRIIQPELAIKDLKQNIILIHGDADSMVPYEVSRDISKKYNKIKFISIKGMDHGFMDEDDEEGVSRKSLNNKTRIYRIIEKYCK
jgi:pimeloyl-ACP methyl ester carboxylesterase